MDVGFGSYPLQGQECEEAVTEALQCGYRFIDTATRYKNFGPIGRAIKTRPREQLYLISKVWPGSQTPDRLKEDLRVTLEELQTPYLDAYLIHWPDSRIPLQPTLDAMATLQKEGKIRDIGFSNVTVNHLKHMTIPLASVQVEMHPFFYDAPLLAYCQERGIGVQAWAPVARGRVNDDPLLLAIAAKKGKTAAQVALRWIVQHGALPLPGSKNKQHIQQNREVFDFSLSDEEMGQINARAVHGERFRVTAAKGWGFTDEFDFTYEECWPLS